MLDRPVIWVNSIGLRRPHLTIRDLRRAASKLKAAISSHPAPGTRAQAEPGSAAFDVVDTISVPASAHPALRAINGRVLSRSVSRAMRRNHVQQPILWLSLPTAVDVVTRLQERAVVYYCGDDWAVLPGVDHHPVGLLEAELVEKATLILAASPAIAAKFPPERTVLIPHGVDLVQFATPAPVAADLPRGVNVAGFFGALAEWVDIPLLAQAARSCPDWVFFLIGAIQCNISELVALPNVVLAGQRPYQALPSYVQHWAVSLLPFRDTPTTRAFDPLKMREYLAAGTPIASTDFPALDGYRHLIEIGRTPETFVTALRRAGDEGRRRADERRERVAGETWEARATQVSDLLASLNPPCAPRNETTGRSPQT
jgi:glycosyltransferase involved in cell wall biosynthesis